MKHMRLFGGNEAYTKAGLVAGTTTTLSIATETNYSIKGKSYKKAIASNGATPTTDALTGATFTGIRAGQAGIFIVCLDTSGALKVIQGQIVDLVGGAIINGPWFGGDTADLCPIGSILVKVASGGATWTFGASNLTGPPANTTITYEDFAGGMPPRTRVS